MTEGIGPGDPESTHHESTERDQPDFRSVTLAHPIANGVTLASEGYELAAGSTDLQQLPAGVTLNEGEEATWYVKTPDEIIIIHGDGEAKLLNLEEYEQRGANTELRPIGQFQEGRATKGAAFTGRFTEPNTPDPDRPATYGLQLSGEVQEVIVELPRYGTRVGVPQSSSHTVAIMTNPTAYRREHFRPGQPFLQQD